MGPFFGATTDLIHALLMVAWVAGMPLLFLPRWPRLSRYYAFYSIIFIVVNLLSQSLLGECCFTTLARFCWHYGAGGHPLSPLYDEWFTVRLADSIFRMTPSHRLVKIATEGLIFVTAVGIAFRLREPKRLQQRERAQNPRFLDTP